MAKKDFTGDPGGLIGDAMFSVIKPLYKEGEKAKRARRAPRRTYYYASEPKVSQKQIIFSVMGRATQNAGAYFSARDLYYAVRPLAYAHADWEYGKRLEYNYFSQTLLTEYQEWHGAISGLWRDPRGNLHEPHTGKSVALGTREVLAYEFPEYTFDKILYVEKEGEWPKLQSARLAERYDMAIASAKGYPVEAVRELFSRAEGGEYQLFCFHDADLDGYNIARVMREATRRMPGYSVEVVDIGLTVEDALEMGLDPEPFSRKKDISWGLLRSLSETAREYLYRRPAYGGISGERFELNAILPDTARIEYIERKLEENGVRGKVIPPDDKLRELAGEKYRTLTAEWVSEAIEEIISSEEFKEEIADEFVDKFGLDQARRHIEARFEKDRSLSWRKALEGELEEVREKHADALKSAVEKKLRERLADGGNA
ncbi:MAG: hypothetical protein M3R38_29180 [Actinomycetota bacterium]|nr:hypothetical protein [Actinomycetota bacterium]